MPGFFAIAVKASSGRYFQKNLVPITSEHSNSSRTWQTPRTLGSGLVSAINDIFSFSRKYFLGVLRLAEIILRVRSRCAEATERFLVIQGRPQLRGLRIRLAPHSPDEAAILSALNAILA
jgi:hypothetical protein